MDNPVKYAGLNTLSIDDLRDLRDAIEDEIEARQKKVCDALSLDLKGTIAQIINGGFSIILEDSEDEIEIVPQKLRRLEITDYPTV